MKILPFSYLLIDLATLFFPFVMSFEKKIHFYDKWRVAFRTIMTVAFLFILWDVLFTYLGVWGFTPTYLTGAYVINLPIEEVLFFIVVPFACLFLYENIHFFLNAKIKKGIFYQVSLVAGLLLFFAGVLNYDKLYTLFACVGASMLLGYHVARKKQINHEVFWVSYLIVLIPFTIVNGILTGYFTQSPIVWYNEAQIFGARFFTIPVEDFVYNLLLMLLNITLYERILKR